MSSEVLFDRANLNFFKKWWIDIDKVSFLLIIGIIFFGLVMAISSSPAIAKRISIDHLWFVKKQVIFVAVAIMVITFMSFLNTQQIKIISIFGLLSCLALLFIVLFIGSEAKGAKRWISMFGFGLQPSEFTKVFFLIFNAFLLQKLQHSRWFISYGLSTALYFLIVLLLILQPDFGMTMVVTVLWLFQLFIFGLPMMFTIIVGVMMVAGVGVAYVGLPHVADRINRFLNFSEKNYQVDRALDGYVNGGFFGVGPGNGMVKQYIPDAHTDFIFAVVAEEFGLIACLIIMFIFLLVVTRIIKRVINDYDLFAYLATTGLVAQLALQLLFNIAMSSAMLPTKGITLPFISYGGSSLIAMSLGFGAVLALSKKKYLDMINYSNILLR
jgi:cell division protein FtsW